MPAAGLMAPQSLRGCSPSICSVPPPRPPASDADAGHWMLGPIPPRMTSAELAYIRKDVIPNKVTLTGTGLPWWLSSKESACDAGDLGSIPGRRQQLPTPVFLPGEFHRQRSQAGYSPQGHRECLSLSRSLIGTGYSDLRESSWGSQFYPQWQAGQSSSVPSPFLWVEHSERGHGHYVPKLGFV